MPDHGLGGAIAAKATVAEDFPDFHRREGVLDSGADHSVGGVVRFLPLVLPPEPVLYRPQVPQ